MLLLLLSDQTMTIVGLGLLLQLDDRRAELVGGGMADRVATSPACSAPTTSGRPPGPHPHLPYLLPQSSDLFAEKLFEFFLLIYKARFTSW